MALSNVEKAISVAEFILKKRKRLVDDMSRKVQITENQKIYIGEETELIKMVEAIIKQARANINIQLGKLPPQALDLEEAVLGAILLEGKVQDVIKILETKHFYKPENQEVFSAIKRVWNADKPVDMKTVVYDLKKYGLLEKVGGAYYIAELTSKVSQSTNIATHAHILIEMAVKRQLILIGGKVMQEAYEDTSDALELLDLVNEEVKVVNGWIK